MAPYSSGTCSCGAVKLAIDIMPLLSYSCHCSRCRKFINRYLSKPVAYSGGAAVFQWNVAIEGEEDISYEQSSALGGLFAMSRGRCSKCHQIVWESGENLIMPFAMVMTTVLPDLKPTADIFYGSGKKEGPTAPLVFHSDLGSLAFEIFMIIFVAIPMIPWSLCARLMRSSASTKPSAKSD